VAVTTTRTTEWLDLRASEVARGVSNAHPIFVQRAEGAKLWDIEGNEYIDFVGGIGVANVGHSHPRIRAAVAEQLERFTHTCFQVAMYESYVRLAQRLDVAYVATNGVAYAMREDAMLADVLTCVKHGTRLHDAGTLLRPNHEHYLKSPAQMAALFRREPQAVRNSRRIAERCAGFDRPAGAGPAQQRGQIRRGNQASHAEGASVKATMAPSTWTASTTAAKPAAWREACSRRMGSSTATPPSAIRNHTRFIASMYWTAR